MDLILTRKDFVQDGVFGELAGADGGLIAVTLEHAYLQSDGSFKPKLKAGRYQCRLGPHRLKPTADLFDTFEIENVPGHFGILFHAGNFNADSDGCVLLGEKIVVTAGQRMITNSRATFKKFIALQNGAQTFELDVRDLIC